MTKLFTGLLLVLGGTACVKPIAMASHKDKLYVFKDNKMFVCETDQSGTVACTPATTNL